MKKIKTLVYTVSKYNVYNERTTFTGTLEELVNNTFAYTLEVGNSFNPTIPIRPTNIFELVKALNRSASEVRRYNDCYEFEKALNRDVYETITHK